MADWENRQGNKELHERLLFGRKVGGQFSAVKIRAQCCLQTRVVTQKEGGGIEKPPFGVPRKPLLVVTMEQ